MFSRRTLMRVTRRNAIKFIWLISAFSFIVKIFIIINIPSGSWLGADGESYINGVNAMITDGIFSSAGVLHYWPAGYPLTILFSYTLIPSSALAVHTLLQSALYCFCTGYFASQLNKTNLRKFAIPSVLLLNLSPTLSISSLLIGYESVSASCLILALGFFVSAYVSENKKFNSWQVLTSAIFLSINCFIQPRFLMTSVIFLSLG